MHCTSQYTKDTNNILSNYLIFHIFGAFSSKKYHFSPKSPEFRRKVAEFRPKVAEFHPEFPEFHFSNLNSPPFGKHGIRRNFVRNSDTGQGRDLC